MEKKITKKEMFAQIREVVKDNAEFVAFIDHEIALLDKKAGSKKPTATQIANEAFKASILDVLSADEGMTVSEVIASSDDLKGLSNQKVSALLKLLKDEGKVVKELDKKKSVFKLA